MNALFANGSGTALFWVLVSVAAILIAAAVVLLVRHIRIKKLLSHEQFRILADASYTDEQLKAIEDLLADTGFAFDAKQNIYYSIRNPWQREMGYCSLYDDWATPMGMVFDSEPVRFEYNGKKWLIEFWKGQYGITVGGEIGIYNTAGPDLSIPGVFKGTFYHSASDEEGMDMSFRLYKNEEPMFQRAGRHWWLTGFVLGAYAQPRTLSMEATVTFPNLDMRDAFLLALYKLGYRHSEVSLDENTVGFTLAMPRSKQPPLRYGFTQVLTMLNTQVMVAQYRSITDGKTNMYDILNELQTKAPALYQLAIAFGRQKELYGAYDSIRAHIVR